LGSVENLACIDTHLAIQFGSGRSAASAGNGGGKKRGQTMDVVLRWVIIGIVALAAWPRHSAAQDYPTHSVTILVPFAPGGGTDLIARAVGHKLEQRLGETFVSRITASPKARVS